MDKRVEVFKDINYAVRCECGHDALRVSFAAFSIYGITGDGEVLYSQKGNDVVPVSSLDEAEPFVSGDVKWDGCSNFWFGDQEQDTMIHKCSREGLVAIGVLLSRCWDIAHRMLGERSDCRDDIETGGTHE